MKVFQGIAVTIMGAFFVWLLLQMSRTARSDQLLITLGLAYLGAFAALAVGALLGRRG